MIFSATSLLTAGEESSIAISTRSIISAIRCRASTICGAAGISLSLAFTAPPGAPSRRLHLGGALFRIEGSNAMATESDVSVIVWIDGKFVKDVLLVIASDTKTIMRKPRPAVTCQITETD
jgi:hypothetical protein